MNIPRKWSLEDKLEIPSNHRRNWTVEEPVVNTGVKVPGHLLIVGEKKYEHRQGRSGLKSHLLNTRSKS